MKSYMIPAEHHIAVQRALHLGRSGDAAALPELIALYFVEATKYEARSGL